MSDRTKQTDEQSVRPSDTRLRIRDSREYRELYTRSIENAEEYWREVGESIDWFEPPKVTLDATDAPFFRWYDGGTTNVVLNAIDRHIAAGRGERVAIYWEGELGDTRVLTYNDLNVEVCKFANVLKSLGVRQSDRVAIYMPRIPEQAIGMLATAKIGAVHTVVYAGLSVEALRSRVADAEAKVVITADGGYLSGKTIHLKGIVDEAVNDLPSVSHVIVARRTNTEISWNQGRDLFWDDVMSGSAAHADCRTQPVPANDPFFIIYTSGSTGAPKGVVHAVGGFCADVYSSLEQVLGLRDGDVLFCTSDAGWLVGHTITLYGALMHGISTVIYEGSPAYPAPDRWWKIIERYRATVFYTSPTGIRGLMRFGDDWPRSHDLRSLRLLAVAGEPLNPAAWQWFHDVIGGGRLPVIDSWWQTETSRPIISNLPALSEKPGSCGLPMPGIGVEVVDENGRTVPKNTNGLLVLTTPFPGMARTIYKDPERFKSQYWMRFPGVYSTGDSARIDDDGYVWVTGRVDDVIKVSGYRLGTAEIESALVNHERVAEAAVIGLPDEVRGNEIHAFVVLVIGAEDTPELAEELRSHVAAKMGPIARPRSVTIVPKLPKTRSGKIMRRVLRSQALGEPLGDTSMMEE